MNSLKLWFLAARPKTLVASVVPILTASGLAIAVSGFIESWISWCAFLSATFIQIGTNFFNDAIDFEKGADSATRLGPQRVTHAGHFTASSVKRAAVLCFALAVAFGIPLVYVGGWTIVCIGLVSLVFGYAYTGGPFPLAYLGLGDLFVLLFYGGVAVSGIYFLHMGVLYTLPVLILALQVGLQATALIAINNLRDYQQDRLVKKNTLAVRLGPTFSRIEITMCLALPLLMSVFWFRLERPWAVYLPQLSWILVVPLVLKIWRTEPSAEYNSFLARAAAIQLLTGLMLYLGFTL